MVSPRERAGRIFQAALNDGNFLPAFEAIYQAFEAAGESVPWADLSANANLQRQLQQTPAPKPGTRALVIACGLGDDAECLASAGYEVTAFDLAATAIATAKRRFPESRVEYLVADLFDLPDSFREAFDLVFEVNTLQALPESLRAKALDAIAATVRGELWLEARLRDPHEPSPATPPWPLLASEVRSLVDRGFSEHEWREFSDVSETSEAARPIRRQWALYSWDSRIPRQKERGP